MLVGWPLVGMLLETYGFVLLFRYVKYEGLIKNNILLQNVFVIAFHLNISEERVKIQRKINMTVYQNLGICSQKHDKFNAEVGKSVSVGFSQ